MNFLIPFLYTIIVLLLASTSIAFTSQVTGQVFVYDPHQKEWEPFTSCVVFAIQGFEETEYGSLVELDGDYQFFIPPGNYTIQMSATHGIRLDREISVEDGETVIVSYKVTPTIIWAHISSTPATGASGYLITSKGSPIDGAILELPEIGISTVTTDAGTFSLSPFNRRTELQIHYPNAEDTYHSIVPTFSPLVIRIDSNNFCKMEESESKEKIRSEPQHEPDACQGTE